MTLEDDIAEYGEASSKSQSVKSELNERIIKIREKISNGKTTGDKIKDFLIFNGVQYSDGEHVTLQYARMEQNLRELDAVVKNNIGNQFLLIKQDEEEDDSGLFDEFKHINNNLELGVVSGELAFYLKIHPINPFGDNYDVIIPTGKKVVRGPNNFNSGWELKEGDLGFDMGYASVIGRELSVFDEGHQHLDDFLLFRDSNKGLVFYTGDEVPLYFGLHQGHRSLIITKFRKGEISKEKLDEIVKLDKSNIDISYVDALNLLGVEAPPEFKEIYDKRKYEEKVGIVSRLRELIGKKPRIRERIRSLYEVAGSGGGGLYEDGADTSIVDRDDAFVVSWADRDKLKETEREIVGLLETVKKLGIDKGEMKIELEPGLTLDVPKYLSAVLDVYEMR